MRRQIVYALRSLYRDDFRVESFTFGGGSRERSREHSMAVMGSLRGDEVQQLFIASQLVRALGELERHGLVADDAEICVIPCGNPFSLNTSTRFWGPDGTDVNRMFPGYDRGETTQRIAAGVFGALQGFGYGVQLSSFYLPGEFVPHVRMMDTGFFDISLASDFGLPYAVVRRPEPVDSGTLNYNWQIWDTRALSVYSRTTAQVDGPAAEVIVRALLRFMVRRGMVRYDLHGGFTTTVVKEEHLVNVRSARSGIMRLHASVGDHVRAGETLATITDPLTGETREELRAPCMGVVFFSSASPLASADTIVYRLIADQLIEDMGSIIEG